MRLDHLCSDKLFNYPDNHAKLHNQLLASKTQSIASTIKSDRTSNFARLSYRAIQTLWQVKLQMCQRTWTWPEILPFSQYSGRQAGDGLCATELQRSCQKSVRKLSKNKRNHGADK